MNTTTLAQYDIHHDTVIAADASSYGLGAVICQRQGGNEWRLVAYAMTTTETRYAQIEKEALACL